MSRTKTTTETKERLAKRLEPVTNAQLCLHRANLAKEDLKKHLEKWPNADDTELTPVSYALGRALQMLDELWERRRRESFGSALERHKC